MIPRTRRTLRPRHKHPEFTAQVQAVAWLRISYPQYEKLLTCIDNNARSAKAGHQKRLMGCVKGFVDLLLLVPANGFHGLAIEMKAPGKKATPDQRAQHAILEGQGYKVAVVDSFQAFKDLVYSYLGKEKCVRPKK